MTLKYRVCFSVSFNYDTIHCLTIEKMILHIKAKLVGQKRTNFFLYIYIYIRLRQTWTSFQRHLVKRQTNTLKKNICFSGWAYMFFIIYLTRTDCYLHFIDRGNTVLSITTVLRCKWCIYFHHWHYWFYLNLYHYYKKV